MMSMTQICEDIPQVLDLDVPGLAERPINIFLPRLLQVKCFYLFILVKNVYLGSGVCNRVFLSTFASIR